jgi:hypothetical protein
MPAGSIQKVLVCIPKIPNTGPSTAPCATVGTARYEPATIDAFVVDPSLESVLSSLQTANTGTYDYAQASQWFAASFTIVIVIWIISKKIGAIISLLRSL